MRRFLFGLGILFTGTVCSQTIDQFPTYDDLETWSLCSEYCSIPCAISSNWSNQGNIDFRPDTAGTPSLNTGPTLDHNPGTSTGVYAYVESTDTCNSDTAILESPFVDLTNVLSPGFSFWFHQFSPDSITDTFDLQVSTDSGATWVTALTGPDTVSQDLWRYDSLGLNAYSGLIIKLRFRFITYGDSVDFAVDDFTFYGEQYVDAGVLGVSASPTCPGDTSTVCVTLVNAGLLPIDTVTIMSTVNGAALFNPYVFIGNLLPGDDTLLCIGDTTLANNDSIGIFSSMPNNLIDTLNINDTFSYIFSTGQAVTASAGNDTTVCSGVTFQIGGSPTGNVNSIYNWTPGVLLNDSTIANPLITVSQDTLVLVSVTDTVTGCTDMDTIDVTINPSPIIDAGQDTINLCQGDTITLGGSPTTSAANSVSWSPGVDLDDSTLFNPLLTADQIYFIYVTTTEPINSCTSSDSILINASGTPNVEAGISYTICAGDSVVLGGAPTSNLAGDIQWSGAGLMNEDTIANPTATAFQDTFFVVTVTTQSGCSDFDTIFMNVNDVPPVAITSSGACIGDTFQLTATGGLSYAWAFDTTLSDSTIGNPLAYPTGNNHTYIVTATAANGCTDTAQITVSYFSDPIVDAGENDTICNGSISQLSASGASNYVWTPTLGLDDPNIGNPQASPSSSIEYFVEGTDVNGCSAIDSVSVFVNVLPSADAGPDTGVCLLDSVQIGGNPTGPAGATYSWPSAGINNPTNANPFFNASTFIAGVYNYEVTVTDVNGCQTTDDVDITVWPDPVASIDPFQDPICIGDSLLLNAQGGTGYAWSPGVSLTSTNTQSTTAFPIANTDYSVTVTDANGCTSVVQEEVAVYPLTPADAGADLSICQQDTIQLDASGGVNYTWSNSPFIGSLSGANPMAYPVVTTTFSVTVTDANGCSEPDQVTITVNPLPLVSAGANKRTCLDEEVEIGGTPTGPAGSSYSWYPSTSLSNASSANPIAKPTSETRYYVTVTSSFGCQDSANMLVSVDTLPVVDVVQQPLPYCDGDSAVIEVKSGFASYTWLPNLKISTTVDPRVEVYPSNSKTYSVSVVDRNGCKGDTSVFVKVFQLPIVSASDDFEICEGDSFQIEAFGGVIYEWSNGATLADSMAKVTMSYPTETTQYKVTVTDTNSCQATAKLIGIVNPLPEIDAGDDIDNCDIDVVYLGGEPTGPADAIFYWTPAIGLDDQFNPNPQVLYPERTMYHLEVQDRNGCISTDSILVNADCYTLIYAPSAFTPGFNGLNAVFKIEHHRIVDPHLRIYNRLGGLMFETNDLDDPWDGTEPNSNTVAPSGVYYWILEYRTETKKKASKDGVVTLLK